MAQAIRPVMLAILDGWGERKDADDNAISRAKTPVWHQLMARWPHAHLEASEHYVGLPTGRWATPKSAIPISAPAAW